MSKNKFNLRQAVGRQVEIRERIQEIAALCETEQRERNESENAEYVALMREAQTIEMQMRAATMVNGNIEADLYREAFEAIRSRLGANQAVQVVIREEIGNMTQAMAVSGGQVALNIHDIVQPLEQGLLLTKLGIPFYTGLTGDHIWPVVDAIEATVAGEGVKLGNSKIPLSKCKPVPQRIGCAIPVTSQAITASAGMLENIVKQQLPKAISRTLNKIAFSPSAVNGATTLIGPFATSGVLKSEFSGSVPTYAELLAMKGKIMGAGVENDGTLAYVMTETMKAVLEATPKDQGSGLMIIQNDAINGVPVLCTNYVGEDNIGLGVWSYFPMGQFGNIRMTIDPLSKSREDVIDCVINTDAGSTVLRKEAFCMYSVNNEA